MVDKCLPFSIFNSVAWGINDNIQQCCHSCWLVLSGNSINIVILVIFWNIKSSLRKNKVILFLLVHLYLFHWWDKVLFLFVSLFGFFFFNSTLFFSWFLVKCFFRCILLRYFNFELRLKLGWYLAWDLSRITNSSGHRAV